jgi:uncharacterized repeat protein (TIGR01451 family)
MNTKLISKFRKWRVTGAIALVIVFSMALSMLPVPAAADPGMTVHIIECPGMGCADCMASPIPVSTYFGIKAEIINNTSAVQHDVVAHINISGGKAELKDCIADIQLGTMDKGERNTVAWTLHCTGEGLVGIDVNTNKGGSSHCEFMQKRAPNLVVDVDAPCEVCTNCGDQSVYQVTATVTNYGDVSANGLLASITADPPTAVTILTPPKVSDAEVGDQVVTPLDDESITWTVQCNSDDDVTFRVDIKAWNAITNDPILPSPYGTKLVYQQDFLVNILCVRGLELDGVTPACGASCADSAVVSTEQMFEVVAKVNNCSGAPATANISIAPLPPGTKLAEGKKVHVTERNQNGIVQREKDVAQTDTLKFGVPGDFPTPICACCTVEARWVLECETSTEDTCEPVVVKVTTADGTWDNTLCDPACIEQEAKVHITGGIDPANGVGMAAYVYDCGYPYEVDTIAVGQKFDVKFCFTNDDPANPAASIADATGVVFDLVIHGPVSCNNSGATYVGLPVDQDGNDRIYGGATECVWLSSIVGGCECLGEGEVTFTITDVRGLDENTCEEIKEANIANICDLVLNQCDIEVEIINPHYCDNINECELFAVKALIRNNGDCVLQDVAVELSWTPGAQVELVTPKTVIVGDILPEEVDPEVGPVGYSEEEVTWQLKCMGGDPNVTFHVCATSNYYGVPDQPGAKVIDMQVQDKNSPAVTIHQIPREPADVVIKILSPDNFEALYATSEEFAVTAIVVNNEDYATVEIQHAGLNISPSDAASYEPEFDVPFSIIAGGMKTLTWTVHCEHSGLMSVAAWVDGRSEVCQPVNVTSCPIAVHQYPAAHLVVEIVEAPDKPVVTCTSYNVTATITNTGEADADEVYATVSVDPAGSVRVSELDPEGTYTKYVGTIPGSRIGEVHSVDVTWTLHCKVACDSEITVGVTGDDEYGWHLKQHCASSGHFAIEKGIEHLNIGWSTDDTCCDSGMVSGIFVGDAAGLVGPFIFDTNFGFKDMPPVGSDVTGRAIITGYVDHLTTTLPTHLPGLPDPSILGDIPPGSDLMVFTGNVYLNDCVPCFEADYCTDGGGIITVVNGLLTGQYMLGICNPGGPCSLKSLLGGTYCTRLAAEAGRTIDAKFIESDGVTVKQLPADIDLRVAKSVTEQMEYQVGNQVTYTVSVTNDGPGYASGVIVKDVLPDSVSYQGDTTEAGWYDVGSGQWVVGNLEVDETAQLMIDVGLVHPGEICNRATVVASDQHELDIANDSAEVCISVQELPGEGICECCLTAGYNLISLPCIPSVNDIVTMCSSVNVSVVSSYVAADVTCPCPPGFPGWYYYYQNPPPGWDPLDDYPPDPSYQTLATMEDGWGYWMDMNKPGCLTYLGYPLAPPAPDVPHSYDVVIGWNLVGFKSTIPQLASDYLASIEGKYHMMYGYENGAYFIAGTYGRKYLEPCHGYWLSVTAEGTIYP